MATIDVELAVESRKKFTPPPSVLQTKCPVEPAAIDTRNHLRSPSFERRSKPLKQRRATAPPVRVLTNNNDFFEVSISSYGWQRHSDKAAQISPAPDVLYRNTYLESAAREKSAGLNSDSRSRLSSPRSVSPRSQQSQPQYLRIKTATTVSPKPTETPNRNYDHSQYHSVYDYIRDSIKQIERQRNLKQEYFATRIKRPQNDDSVLRKALREKKNSGNSSNLPPGSPKSKKSTSYQDELRSPESLINYLNYSRERLRLIEAQNPYRRYYQHQMVSKRHPSAVEDSRQVVITMMTATVGNS